MALRRCWDLFGELDPYFTTIGGLAKIEELRGIPRDPTRFLPRFYGEVVELVLKNTPFPDDRPWNRRSAAELGEERMSRSLTELLGIDHSHLARPL